MCLDLEGRARNECTFPPGALAMLYMETQAYIDALTFPLSEMSSVPFQEFL